MKTKREIKTISWRGDLCALETVGRKISSNRQSVVGCAQWFFNRHVLDAVDCKQGLFFLIQGSAATKRKTKSCTGCTNDAISISPAIIEATSAREGIFPVLFILYHSVLNRIRLSSSLIGHPTKGGGRYLKLLACPFYCRSRMMAQSGLRWGAKLFSSLCAFSFLNFYACVLGLSLLGWVCKVSCARTQGGWHFRVTRAQGETPLFCGGDVCEVV